MWGGGTGFLACYRDSIPIRTGLNKRSERSSPLYVTNWLQSLGQTLKTAALFQGGYEQKPGASWSTILADHTRLDEGPIRMQHASRDIAECRPFTILYMDLTIDVPFCMDLTILRVVHVQAIFQTAAVK